MATFLTILKSECARFQSLYPERADEISRTQAMIIAGGVLEMDDGNGQVCSRDGATWYTVNSHCDCQAASYGKPCRHLAAWKLFQHVQKKMQCQAALETPATREDLPLPAPETTPVERPQDLEVWPDNDAEGADESRASPPVETAPVPQPLPEAPASVNVRVTISGYEVQWTLRDTDEGRLAERLAQLLARYPKPQPPPPQPPASQPPAPLSPQQTGWCGRHDCTMHLNTGKDGRQWWSHKLPEGGFCKGK